MSQTLEQMLFTACELRHLDVVKYLVEKGADIHAANDYALRYASFNGHLDVVKYLVEKGANIHAVDDYALRYAADNGRLDVVKYLVEKGARNGHLDVVEYLKGIVSQEAL